MSLEIKLPIPFDGISHVEAEIPQGKALAEVREMAAAGKYEQAVWALLRGATVRAGGKPITGMADKERWPWKSAEYVVFAIIRRMRKAARLADEFMCPNCRHPRRRIQTKEGDDRIDLEELPVTFAEEGKKYVVKGLPAEEIREMMPFTEDWKSREAYDEEVRRMGLVRRIKTESVELEVRSMTFRPPTVQDMQDVARNSHDMGDFQRNLSFRVLVDAAFEMSQKGEFVEDFQQMKRVCGKMDGGLTEFNWEIYGDEFNEAMNEDGFVPMLEESCMRCGYEWDQFLSMRDFFDSALLSNFTKGRAARRRSAGR